MIWNYDDFLVALYLLFSNLHYITRKSKAQSILHEHLASRKFKIIIIYMHNIYIKIFNDI